MGAANSNEIEKEELRKRAKELDKTEKELDKREKELDKREKELDKREKELDKRAEELDKKETDLKKRETELKKIETDLKKGESELKKGESELKKAGGADLAKLKMEKLEAPNNCGCWYNQTAEESEDEAFSFFCHNTGCPAVPSPGSILLKLCCCC
ncbi:hypothetical protein R3I93_014264 [Phoxinus phoxinus]